MIKTNSGEFNPILKTKWGTFELANEDKVRRVIDGEANDKGVFTGGLGVDAKSEDVLILYDKKGGLIKGKEGSKVKTGSFYDFQKKSPRKEPEIVYVFRINGKEVEYVEGEEKPLEIRAAELLAEAEAKSNKSNKSKK